jgi:hypothetical protein
MKKICLFLILVSNSPMKKESEGSKSITLPALSKKDMVGSYLKNEAWKGLSWSTLGLGLGTMAINHLSKRYPDLKLLYSLKNKNVRKYAIGLLYGLPHFFNFFKYKKISETMDLSAFRVNKNNQENELAKRTYTKFYFQPNPFKILVKRLMSIETADENSNQIYDQVVENLTVENLAELMSYLEENNDNEKNVSKNSIFDGVINSIRLAIEKNIHFKLETLSSDSFLDVVGIYDLLENDKKKALNEKILEKINSNENIKKSILEIKNLASMYRLLDDLGDKKLQLDLFNQSLKNIQLGQENSVNEDLTRSLVLLTLLFVGVEVAEETEAYKATLRLSEKIKEQKIIYGFFKPEKNTYWQSYKKLNSMKDNGEISSDGYLSVKILLPYLVYKHVCSRSFLGFLSIIDEKCFSNQKVYLKKLIQQVERSNAGFIAEVSWELPSFENEDLKIRWKELRIIVL